MRTILLQSWRRRLSVLANLSPPARTEGGRRHDGTRRTSSPRHRRSNGWSEWASPEKPLVLSVLCVLAFLLGGSSRGDAASLMVLRPTATLLLGYGLLGLSWDQVKAYRHLFILGGGMATITLLHLVPLPPVIWSQLPHRQLIVEIDHAAGLGNVWRPITMAPEATWNGLYALIVPFAALVLAVRLPVTESRKLLITFVALASLSALIAVVQIIGPTNGAAYFYRITNAGTAVGLFANRNHQAVLLALMLPMIAAFASLSSAASLPGGRRAAIGLAMIGIFLIPLIFVTGSRTGLLAMVLGLASCALLYRPAPAKARHRSEVSRFRGNKTWRLLSGARMRPPATIAALLGVAVISLSLVTIALGRAEAFQRIFAREGGEEFRLKHWPSVVRIATDYLPWGSGMGSFVPVYKVGEPRELLTANYFNHAHNDYLEILLTGGIPAMLLLVYAIVLFIVGVVRAARHKDRPGSDALLGRLGLILIMMLALASLGDYPLRTPSLEVLFTLAAVWAAMPISVRDTRTPLIDPTSPFPHGDRQSSSKAV